MYVNLRPGLVAGLAAVALLSGCASATSAPTGATVPQTTAAASSSASGAAECPNEALDLAVSHGLSFLLPDADGRIFERYGRAPEAQILGADLVDYGGDDPVVARRPMVEKMAEFISDARNRSTYGSAWALIDTDYGDGHGVTLAADWAQEVLAKYGCHVTIAGVDPQGEAPEQP